MTDAPYELTLWAANLIGRPLRERIEAALAGGFSAISLLPIELRAAAEDGVSPAAVRARVEESGLRVISVEPLALWLPDAPDPGPLPDDDPAAGAFRPPEVFAQAAAVGAGLVTVISVFDDRVDFDRGAEAFAALCDDAAQLGIRLQLEFIPGTGVADLAHAWEIVRRSDRPNGGLILDSWHFFRSNPDFELLASLPADRVFAIQLEDAPAHSDRDPAEESLHGRLIPGAGELDLERFLTTLLRAGVPASIGPEVFADGLREQEPAHLGWVLGDSTRALVDRALAAVGGDGIRPAARR